MTLTLTLVRHGQTHLNARRMLQGSIDSPLTRTGLAGVRVTAQHLSDRRFDAIFSSPQGRAVTTAVEISRLHPYLARIHTDEGLREFSFGEWEGRPEQQMEAEHPWSELVPAILSGTHPGFAKGESAAAFMRRTTTAFDRIIGTRRSGEVLVVGHGLTLGAWLTTIDPQGLAALPNASVTTVTIDGGTRTIVEVGRDVAGHGMVATRPVETGLTAV
jgi:2,3-bisphosphoglycerate-dependent phosphoglycerate mutase